ncbi:efflux RND transporter periplasmic adaptor subunit [Sporomusa carbonis]|uniref:efflux RND transporter periplasmic adaptor subunit n=1 Tax=Sporomusa carbonis TaxID=3076075 RepID=UPI003C7C2F0F
MLKKRYRYTAGVLLIVCIAALLASCGSKIKPAMNDPVKKLAGAIRVEQVQAAPAEQYYETSGTVKAKTVSKIAPKVMGEVTAVYVKAGDRVQAGQVLAEIADTDIRQKLAAAEAGLREAEKGMQIAERSRSLQAATYERYERLYQQAAISRQQVDEIRTQHEMAQLAYEQAKASMEKATAGLAEVQVSSRLVSPISGIVTEKTLELGSMVQAGVSVITVEDNGAFLIECYVESGLTSKIQTGMNVWVDFDGVKEPMAGQVSEVVPAVDSASRSFLVKILLTGTDLKTGLYGKVRFPIGQQSMILVPQAAVISKGQLTGVYIMDENKRVWYRLVRTGRQQDGKVEIVSGLKGGEYVVVRGMEDAVDGALAGEVTGL